jgi:hypothetical protein
MTHAAEEAGFAVKLTMIPANISLSTQENHLLQMWCCLMMRAFQPEFKGMKDWFPAGADLMTDKVLGYELKNPLSKHL